MKYRIHILYPKSQRLQSHLGPFFANSANDHWVQLCWSSSRAHKLHILQSSTLKREDATSSASSFFCCFYCETHFKWRSWDDDVIKYNISLCSKNKVGSSHQGRGTFLLKSPPHPHGVWKSPKKSHSTLRANRPTFIFSVDKSWLENIKNGEFWRRFGNLKLAVKQCYQTGQFWKDKNWWSMPKLKHSNEIFWVIFEHYEPLRHLKIFNFEPRFLLWQLFFTHESTKQLFFGPFL